MTGPRSEGLNLLTYPPAIQIQNNAEVAPLRCWAALRLAPTYIGSQRKMAAI